MAEPVDTARRFSTSAAFMALALAALPVEGASFRVQADALRANGGDASETASRPPASQGPTKQGPEDDASPGGALYTPFAEIAAKPVARVEPTSGDRLPAYPMLLALAALTAAGVLIFWVRRTWKS